MHDVTAVANEQGAGGGMGGEGGEGGEGGGGFGCGGGGDAATMRVWQSPQSVPSAQKLPVDPGPPSVQSPSKA